MKKISSVVTLITLMLSANGNIYFNANKVYPNTAVITCTDEETDLVYCIDNNKNIWSFEGIEDFEAGDVVSLIMDKNGTENIYDDIITAVKYSGTVEDLYPYYQEQETPEQDQDQEGILFLEYLESIANGSYIEY